MSKTSDPSDPTDLGDTGGANTAHGRGGRLLVHGSLNQDLLVDVVAAPAAGETVLATSMTEGLGGKGANQAMAAAAMGQDTELVAAVGRDDAGDQARRQLADAGVRVNRLQVHDDPTGRALVLLEPSGENRIVVVSGANQHLDPPTPAMLEGVGAVLCQLETPLPTVRAALVAARAAGALTVLNAAPADAAAVDLLPLVDVLVVNEREAAQLGGGSGLDAAVAELHRRGAAIVVVTRGGRGALWSEAGSVTDQPAFAVDVLDTTGAGDCFVGALVAGLLGGAAPAEALRLACAAGALATTRRGAAARPTTSDVAALTGAAPR